MNFNDFYFYVFLTLHRVNIYLHLVSSVNNDVRSENIKINLKSFNYTAVNYFIYMVNEVLYISSIM